MRKKIFKKRRVFGGVWAVSGRCLGGVWAVSGRAVGSFDAVAVCVAGLCFGRGGSCKFCTG